MNYKILLALGLLLLLPLATATTDVSVNVNSDENINGYFNLNSQGDTNVWIDGTSYPDFVQSQIAEATKGGMTRTGIADTLEKSWETFIGTRRPDNYDMRIANVYFRIIMHTLNYVSDNWILPMQIRQNAIINTLDQDSYCKNYAKEHFKAFPNTENVKCSQNNVTYYEDMGVKIAICREEFKGRIDLVSREGWEEAGYICYDSKIINDTNDKYFGTIGCYERICE